MKLLFLGIDALDLGILKQHLGELPNFSRLLEGGKILSVVSTFPPDSDTAWATIMTGLNPAQHGYVKFVDPLEKSYRIMNTEDDNRILHGNTFWDILSEAGYKTCALFPHLCYPLWESRSVMISRAKVTPEVGASNPELLALYPHPEMIAGIRGLPDRNRTGMQKYYTSLWDLAEADAEFGLRLYQSEEWDLFFIYWSTLDAVGHFFWNSYDQADPFFKKGNPFEDIIPGTYRLFDRILGKFLDIVPDDVTIMLLSDHGHGARPVKTVNVNEILREAGYLVTKSIKQEPHLGLLQLIKRTAIRIISKFGQAKLAGKIMRHFPRIVQMFTKPSLIRWDECVAYATDMSGIKAYTYGGIAINRDRVDNQEAYEEIRSKIITLVKEKCRVHSDQPLLKFIARREDIYNGPYLDRYPDLVVEFEYGYGVGWAVDVPLITMADSYNLVPGSHRSESGTCIIKGARKVDTDVINLLDILPTVMDLFNEPLTKSFDGKSSFSQES